MFRLTSSFLVLCLGCLLGYLVTAHSGPQGARADAENKTVRAVRSAECRWASEPITLDGKLDEPAWRSAQVLSR